MEEPLFRPTRKSPREEACRWIAEHPEAMRLFETFAMEARRRRKRFGINALRERVRWETAMEWDGDEFKIPNSHSPYIARRLIWMHPDLQLLIDCHLTTDEQASGRTSPEWISDADLEAAKSAWQLSKGTNDGECEKPKTPAGQQRPEDAYVPGRMQ